MNKSLLAAAVVACLLTGTTVAHLAAQNPGAPGGAGFGARPGAVNGTPPSVAVVDIETIFKNLNGFKQQMDGMQREVKEAEDKLNKDRLQINKLIEDLKASQLKPNSPEFRAKETVIAQKQADFQVRKQLQTRDLMEREASVYYKNYQEINEAIRYYAESRGITLVLRYSSNPVDPTDRESVFRELSKPVVYQHSSDITQVIIEELNRRNVAAGAGTPGGPSRGAPPSNVGPGGYPGGASGPGAGGPPRSQPYR